MMGARRARVWRLRRWRVEEGERMWVWRRRRVVGEKRAVECGKTTLYVSLVAFISWGVAGGMFAHDREGRDSLAIGK